MRDHNPFVENLMIKYLDISISLLLMLKQDNYLIPIQL